jgi:hypothetical protein
MLQGNKLLLRSERKRMMNFWQHKARKLRGGSESVVTKLILIKIYFRFDN